MAIRRYDFTYRLLTISHQDYTYLIVDDTEFVSPDKVTGADDVTFAIDLSGEVKGKIAGYPIKDLILTFAYDGEYKLIAVKVELIKGNYDDLKTKLTKVYGEGEHKETEEGIFQTDDCLEKRAVRPSFFVPNDIFNPPILPI